MTPMKKIANDEVCLFYKVRVDLVKTIKTSNVRYFGLFGMKRFVKSKVAKRGKADDRKGGGRLRKKTGKIPYIKD